MKFNYHKKRQILVSNDELKKTIYKLAHKINKDYKNKEPILIALMNSSFVFIGHLVQHLEIGVEVEFLKIYTYSKVAEKKIDTERIKQHFDWERLKGRDIIIADELIDSGDSLDYVTKHIKKHCHPKSVKSVVLLEKKRKRPFDIKPDYVGKKIPNEWITGFGMGYKYKFRNLRDIVILDDEEKGLKDEVKH